MPRKKQKGPPPRANRPGGPKQGQAQGQGATSAQQKGGKQNANSGSGAGNGNGNGGSQKLQPLQQNQRPIVPFLRGDRILLIGEGESLLFALFNSWFVLDRFGRIIFLIWFSVCICLVYPSFAG